ncbi:MAG: hypothetical protein NC035_03920, partial [Bacteroides sp.]|nr:hypothetical protein [Bacteroides sp.]
PREIKFRSVWCEESVRLLMPLRGILTPTTLRRRVLTERNVVRHLAVRNDSSQQLKHYVGFNCWIIDTLT